jgi:hypothetical protein
MFALCGILSCDYSVDEEPAVLAYKYADDMLDARDPKPLVGLPAIKRKGRPRNASRVD